MTVIGVTENGAASTGAIIAQKYNQKSLKYSQSMNSNYSHVSQANSQDDSLEISQLDPASGLHTVNKDKQQTGIAALEVAVAGKMVVGQDGEGIATEAEVDPEIKVKGEKKLIFNNRGGCQK